MNKIFCSSMTVSQCNAPVCVMIVFIFAFALQATHIISSFTSSGLFFELEVIPFKYRLLGLMTEPISYRASILNVEIILL